MTLARWNVSGGPDALLDTVEITDGVTTLRFVDDETDLTTDAGVFTAAAMTLDDLQSGNAAPQALTFEIDNVDGALSVFLLAMRQARRAGTIIRRKYMSSDLSAPVEIYSLTITAASYDAMSARVTGSYLDVLGTAWPRRTYNSTDFPGAAYA